MTPRLRTGDVLLVQGSKWIRMVTGESVSHVAVVVGAVAGAPRTRPVAVVTDYTLREAQRVLYLPDWLGRYRGRRVWHGVAPAEVHAGAAQLRWAAREWTVTEPPYRWWELPIIWWHQLTGHPYRARGPQCHSYAYELWRAAGYSGPPPRDPGDFLALCTAVYRMEV